MKKRLLIIMIMAVAVGMLGCYAASKSSRTGKRTAAKKSMTTKSKQSTSAEKAPASNKDAIVEIITSEGTIKIKLYGDTPLHRDNFLKLAENHYYDGVLFHRVIKDFMIQAGDPDSKNAPQGKRLGAGDPGYTLEAEILYPKHYHKYGALAAARTGDEVNPERRSSGSQFYIVTGTKQNQRTLDVMEQRLADNIRMQYWNKLQKENIDKIRELQKSGDKEALENFRKELVERLEAELKDTELPKLPEQMKEDYIKLGGTPGLDNQYTVFGEVIEGMDIVEKIQNAPTDSSDRPKEDIRIISTKVLEK